MDDWDQFKPVQPPQPSAGGGWDQFAPVVPPTLDQKPVDDLVKSSPYLKDAQNPYEAFVAGLQMSASVIPFHEPNMQVPKNASFASKVSSALGQGLGDIPASVVGFLGGAGAGAAAGAAVPGAGETGASEAVGGVVGAGAGVTAVPQAVREVMMDYYAHKGDKAPMTASDFMSMVAHSAWNITKAGAIGAVGGAAGGKLAGVVGEAGGSAFSQTAANAAGFTLGSTAAQAGLEGKMPDKEDFAANTIAALVMAGASHYAATPYVRNAATDRVEENLQGVYRQTGIPPWEATHMANGDPVLHQELFTHDVNGDPVLPKFNANRPQEPNAADHEVAKQEPETGPKSALTIKDEHEAHVQSIVGDAHIQRHVEELLPQVRATPQPLPETRGQGTFFHGTSKPITKLQDYPGNSESNIYGGGLYTTDAASVAGGYSKKGGGTGRSIYQVNKTGKENLIDMDAPLSPDISKIVNAAASHSELVGAALDNEPTTLRGVYDHMRAESAGLGLPKYEVQEEFDSLASEFQKLGYTGLQHVGGKNTKTAPHTVQIHWEPQSKGISISQRPDLESLVRGLENSGDKAISPKGAIGRYQIMPGTARQYGFDPEKLTDPVYNEKVARTVLADLSRRFNGDTEAVLVAYNAGPGRAMSFVRTGRDTTTLPFETQKYLEHAGFGGKGGKPPEPPIPPEEPPSPEGQEPGEVPSAREQDFSKLTDEMMVSRFQDAIGEQPSRPSTGGNIMRQWVSELESTRAIDQRLTKAGLQDPNKDLTFGDMVRQTYASDDRTNYMLMKGNIDAVTLDAKEGPSLVDVLAKVKEAGGNMDEFDAYRVAFRTLELAGRGIDTGVFKGGAAEAANIIQRPAFQKYKEINAAMQDWKRGGLEYGRDSGLWTDERIKAMEEASSHVSLRRIMGDDKSFNVQMNGPRGLKVNNPLKAMEGSDRQIVKPLLADIDNMRQIIRMADRNRAIGHLLGGQDVLTDKQRMELGQMGFVQLGDNSVKAMLAEPGSSVFKPYSMTPEQEQAALPFANMSNKNAFGGNRFLYYRNGKAEVWEASDPDVAALVRGAENQGDATTISVFGHILNLDKILQGPAKLERAGIMGNLDTALTVPGKHQLTAWALDPLHPPPYITMVKGLHDALMQGPAYWDLMRRGGLSGAITDLDMAKAVDKALDDQDVLKKTGALERTWNSVTSPLAAAQLITEKLTEGERIGYYKRAVAGGMDPNKAAMMGRRAYLDFSEKAAGVTANRLAKMIPFFRASLLGIKYVRDGVQADPKGAILRVTLGLVGAQMALYALNRQADQFIEDPKLRYTSLPQWERDQYYITPPIMGARVKIGRPYVIGPLISIPLERMMEKTFEQNPHAYDDFLSSWVKDIFPSPLPATLKPVLEQTTNHNFFTGRPLISDTLKEATPDQQYQENTSMVARKISSIIGAHTGLGIGEVSPIVLDNYVQAWSGTLGMTVLHTLDAPLGKNDDLTEWKDNVFVRGFTVQNPRMGTQQIDDFYKDAEHFAQLHRDVSLEIKQGNMDQAIADYGEVGKKAALAIKIEHALTVQRTALKALSARKDVTLDEKRQLAQRIYNDAWNIARFGSKALTTNQANEEEAAQIGESAEANVEAAVGKQ